MALFYREGVFTNVTQGGTTEVIEPVWTPIFATPITNRILIAAVANKVTKVLAWYAMGDNATAGSFRFLSNGVEISTSTYYPISTDKRRESMPFSEIGYYKTLPGESLGITVVTASTSLVMDLCTITYTP